MSLIERRSQSESTSGAAVGTLPNYQVVAADLERDRETILSIWQRNLKAVEALPEKFGWHFRNNPAGRGQSWILLSDGEPVGSASLGMRRIKMGDNVVTAGIACDLAVDQQHRFLQPALLLQRALLSSMDPSVQLVYGLPNPQGPGAAVMKRVGYRDLFQVHRSVKLLRISHYLERHRWLRPLAPFAGAVVDPLFSRVSTISHRCGNGFRVEKLTAFDERFDDLWDRLRAEHHTLTVRDRKFLEWRYCECPLRSYTILGLFSSPGERLLGYLVYYSEDDCSVAVDLFAASGGAEIDCLLSAWSMHTRQSGLSSMSIQWSRDDTVRKALFRVGFEQRTAPVTANARGTPKAEPSRGFLVHGRSQGAVEMTGGEWYFTWGDQPY